MGINIAGISYIVNYLSRRESVAAQNLVPKFFFEMLIHDGLLNN